MLKMDEIDAGNFEVLLTSAKEAWAQHCLGVDDVLEQFARERQGSVEYWIEDKPSRAVSWDDDIAKYTISLALITETREATLQLWAATWQDDEKSLTRTVVQRPKQEVPLPVEEIVFVQILADTATGLRGSAEKLEVYDGREAPKDHPKGRTEVKKISLDPLYESPIDDFKLQ